MCPACSVIIPTYNRKEYVRQAIDSVMLQTFTDYEIIVVDDGSTDDTEKALARYGAKIRYFRQKNQGESAARNYGLDIARGKYIAFLDDDDVWLPHKLERQVSYLGAHPDTAMVCSGDIAIDAEGQQIEQRSVDELNLSEGELSFETIFYPCPITASTVLAKKSVLIQAGLFDESMKYGEDWDMWMRVALHGPIGYIPEPLVFFRVHRANQSTVLSTPEEADRWLEDRLRSHEKVFRLWTGSTEALSRFRSRAIALHLAKAAMLDYVHGRFDRAAERLAEVIRLEPAKMEQHGKPMQIDCSLGNAGRSPTGRTGGHSLRGTRFREFTAGGQSFSPSETDRAG